MSHAIHLKLCANICDCRPSTREFHSINDNGVNNFNWIFEKPEQIERSNNIKGIFSWYYVEKGQIDTITEWTVDYF